MSAPARCSIGGCGLRLIAPGGVAGIPPSSCSRTMDQNIHGPTASKCIPTTLGASAGFGTSPTSLHANTTSPRWSSRSQLQRPSMVRVYASPSSIQPQCAPGPHASALLILRVDRLFAYRVGVFFDAVNYGYDIPEVKPWGKTVINVPDCGLNDTWSGCEILVNGTLDVLRRSAMLLNRFGKVGGL